MTVELAHTLIPGVADPVVFLGSIGSDRSMWRPQLERLTRADGPTLLSVDLRGHGGSPAPAGPYRVEELADDVLALLDRLEFARAHLVATGLGGAVAQRIASQAPERPLTLTLLCTAARFGKSRYLHDHAAFVRRRGMGAVTESVLARWFTDEFAATRPDVVALGRAMIAGTDAEGYAACAEALAEWDGRAALASITAPTLVIACAENPVNPPVYLDEIAEGITGARLVIIDDAAQLPTLEQPELITALLTEHHRAAVR